MRTSHIGVLACALAAACAHAAPQVIRIQSTVAAADEAVDSQSEFVASFQAGLESAMTTSECAHALYAVVAEVAPNGEELFGFCDGVMLHRRPDEPGQWWDSLDSTWDNGTEYPGWHEAHFAIGTLSAYASIPDGVRVRVRDGRVHLLKRGFDLRIAPGAVPDAELSARGCTLVGSGMRYAICHRGGGYRVIAQVRMHGAMYTVRSDRRLHATRRQAQAMLLTAQLLHYQSSL